MKKNNKHAGFTLLELLIVIAIIAILSVALIIVINPAETLKKARDAQRISDMNTVKTALGIMLTSTSTPSLDGTFNTGTPAATNICTTLTGGALSTNMAKIKYSTGTAVVYAGLTAGTDSALTTFTSPSTVSGASIAAVDGTGWIPAVLTNLVGGSPISNYPLDPTNTVSASAVSTDLVYRYACQNGGASGKPGYVFEIDATLESAAYGVGGADDKSAKDGGDNAAYYEVGNSLKLLPTTSTF